eukprot:TRINITY_DN2657_c1_g1_i11.p1 TRINITY_DN2657_c1_g1~~TRINITY_DN2657_c1_g1_i11.p1  ORF type:complete len:194 (-),score=31.40 TRINITY_DN2657_c1_g1_i11:672-1253(-)
MFSLSKIEHKMILPPYLLSLPLVEALKGELERLFLDKVIPNLGLCISVYDILKVEDGFIVPGEGAPTYKVIFRLVMFRPFVGEILDGKIEKSGPAGLRLTLGFFSDIHVPVHLIPSPNRMENGIWIWLYGSSEEGVNEMFLDLNQQIRFRVLSIKYPPIPNEPKNDAEPFAPMEITVWVGLQPPDPCTWVCPT